MACCYVTALYVALAGTAQGAVTNFWKLDDTTGGTTVTATVGSNGTYQNGTIVSTTGPGGSITAAFQLDSSSSNYATIAPATVNSGVAASWDIWFKLDTGATTGCLWGGSSSGANSFIRVASDTSIAVRANGPPTLTFTVPSLGTSWRFLLVTKTTGDSYRVFIDGTESSTGGQTSATSMSINKIGSRSASSTPTDFFDGCLAWAKVFDSDESANVAALYAEGTGGGGGGSGGAAYYYQQQSAVKRRDYDKFMAAIGLGQLNLSLSP